MSNPAPGFEKHPNHTVDITPFDGTVSVSVNGEEIAKSSNALQLAEAKYPLVFYIPISDLPEEKLVKSDHQTYCPFKGNAGYYDLVHAGQTNENAVWTYSDPYDEAIAIKDHVAFYANVADVKPV
ncbi:MAG: DUF427 domain-containing protein [Pseudomonadota bacterium]